MGADFHARLHDMLRALGASGSVGRCPLSLRGSLPTRGPCALVEPDGLHRTRSRPWEPQLLRTPIPRCTGPREPGVAAARRGRFERPRRALAPRLPPPPELRGACGRAACAPRRSARRRLPSVTAEPRVPPRMRRCPSGRRPVKRGGRDERLDGQGSVAGGKGRQGGGAQAADRAWRVRQLAQSCGAPPHVPRVGARVVVASVASVALAA